MQETADTPITLNYLVRYIVPLLTIIVAGAAWGTRLEAKSNNHDAMLLELKSKSEASDATAGTLKIEQAKLNGQIETLKVMLGSVADTAKRIEAKLDRETK